jgi:dipeptidyl aminopeptidase/acylaminoacyl peptidase
LTSQCTRVFARLTDPYVELADPALSPDERLLAVQERDIRDDSLRIAIWDLRAHRRLRYLTRGHHDSRPVWSPDGRWIAIWRADYPQDPNDHRAFETVMQTASIVRVPARGGRARTLVARRKGVGPPAWGG